MPPDADLSRTIVYSRDAWQMRLVPGALVLMAFGIVLILMGKAPLGASLAAGAVITARMSVILLIGYFLIFQIFEGRSWALRLAALALAAVALYFYFEGGGSIHPGKAPVAPNLAGGVLFDVSLAYIAYALFRHRVPGEPILMLSPAGVRIHYVWLRDIEIAWSQIEAIENLKAWASPAMWSVVEVPALAVSRATFDRLIAAKRNFLADPFWRHMFLIGDDTAKIVLHPGNLGLRSEDIRDPLVARWSAFRAGPAVPFDNVPGGEPVVLGLWRDDRSWKQALTFGGPLATVLALLLYAVAFPP